MKQLLFVLLMPLAVMAQPGKKTKPVKKAPIARAAQELVVKGTLEGLPEDAPITLISADGTSGVLGSANIKQKKFVLKAKLPETGIYMLMLPQQQMVPLFVGNETITVTGDGNAPDDVVVKGSPSHDDFTAYSNTMQPLLNKVNEILGLAASGATDSMRMAYTNANTALLTAADNFLNKKPASPVAPLMLLVIKKYTPGIDYMEQRFAKLDPKAQGSMYGKILVSQINEAKYGPTPIGSMAPNFSQNDTNGTPVSLSSFKGKYVLIDFWASWCRPCREENPNVVQNYNRFKDKNFTVLGVSLDRSKDPWVQAIAADNLTWTHVSDLKFWNNEVAQLYKINSIPKNVLIDPNGKIVAKDLRGPALESTLCQILGCN